MSVLQIPASRTRTSAQPGRRRGILQDRRFTVEYEKHATSGRRYPDLTVTFRERRLLHLEVKRVRRAGRDPEAKCSEVICDAVQQLVPNALNAIAIGLPSGDARPDFPQVLKNLRDRAERRNGAYFQRHGFTDARDFLRAFGRLSVVVTSTHIRQ